MSNLEERIAAADYHTSKYKEDLQLLISDYNKSREGGYPHDFLDLKDRFIAYYHTVGVLHVRCRELKTRAAIQAKESFAVAYIDEKQNYEGGKRPSNESASISARLRSSKETILEVQAEAAERLYEHLLTVCDKYIVQLSQRIKQSQSEFTKNTNDA